MALGTPVAFPDGAGTTFTAAESALAKARLRRDLETEILKKRTGEMGAITLRPALAERQRDISDLVETRGVFRKAQADLPGVQRELYPVHEHGRRI